MKCPKCEGPLTGVRIEAVTGTTSSHRQFHCIAYTCPLCSHPISVQMDPVALKTDTLSGVQELLEPLQQLHSDIRHLLQRLGKP